MVDAMVNKLRETDRDDLVRRAGHDAEALGALYEVYYESLADISISDRDEDTLIKGLRNFSELMAGAYPSQLAVMTANQEVRKGLLANRLKDGVPLDAFPKRAEIEKAVSIREPFQGIPPGMYPRALCLTDWTTLWRLTRIPKLPWRDR